MSDTPETDIKLAEGGAAHLNVVPASFARSLERRLQEAQRLYAAGCRSWNPVFEVVINRAEKAEAERDAALREVEEHKSRCTVLEAEVAEWKSQFAAALAEKGKP